MYFDVVVAGGSIAGLLCAREIASAGRSVVVIEEDYEIGTPQHCGGLVSMVGLEELGAVVDEHDGTVHSTDDGVMMSTTHHPDNTDTKTDVDTAATPIMSARITAPDGNSFTIDARRQRVVEIDRRQLDKQIARQAQKVGAVIMVSTSLQSADMPANYVRTSRGEIRCRIMVDAMGVSSLVHKDRTGIVPSAQYEVYADWIEYGVVDVIIDSQKYPGFFAWVIPSGDGKGKVGVAGRGINTAKVLDKFLEERDAMLAMTRDGDLPANRDASDTKTHSYRHSTIRKIFAPIWINGPIRNFVEGRVVLVGDAAGQAKPTTGGGIFTSGMGGILAGRAISRFLETGNKNDLQQYQREWTDRFGREFQKQLRARRILERMDNDTINNLFELITPEIRRDMSEKGDFDFHTESIVRALGVSRSIKAAGAVVSGEIRRLTSRKTHNNSHAL